MPNVVVEDDDDDNDPFHWYCHEDFDERKTIVEKKVVGDEVHDDQVDVDGDFDFVADAADVAAAVVVVLDVLDVRVVVMVWNWQSNHQA